MEVAQPCLEVTGTTIDMEMRSSLQQRAGFASPLEDVPFQMSPSILLRLDRVCGSLRASSIRLGMLADSSFMLKSALSSLSSLSPSLTLEALLRR